MASPGARQPSPPTGTPDVARVDRNRNSASAVRSRSFEPGEHHAPPASGQQALRAAAAFAAELADQHAQLIHHIALAERAVEQAEDWARNDAIPALEERLQLAEQEIAELRCTVDKLRHELGVVRDDHELLEDRFRDVERQYLELSQAYVTSSHLHASLDPDEVLANLSAILVNLLGVEAFEVYLLDERSERLSRVAQEGCDGASENLAFDQDGAAQVLASCTLQSVPADQTLPPSPSRALALIPLAIADRPRGLIVIHRVFAQKTSFTSADLELFQLLGAHAATALYAAHAYHTSERKRVTLEGFVDAMRSEFRGLARDQGGGTDA